MAAPKSGRPPPGAFFTVTSGEQARLLSDPESFRYFEPFVARERTASQAAAEVGCKLDAILYRVKSFLSAGLLGVTRLERRAGRPVKHYRSAAEAYFVPFEVTPYAEVEERLEKQYREQRALIVPVMAKALRTMDKEGRRIFRRRDNGELWQESAADTQTFMDVYDPKSYEAYIAAYHGPMAELMSDDLALTDQEAKEFIIGLYEVWRRFQAKKHLDDGQTRHPYFLQFTFLPRESG